MGRYRYRFLAFIVGHNHSQRMVAALVKPWLYYGVRIGVCDYWTVLPAMIVLPVVGWSY